MTSQSHPKTLKVSLITTERNEVDSISEFIDSVLSQSRPPDEIVIADGGSTDGTLAIIQGYIDQGAPIRLITAPGNRSIGRNAATKAAQNEIIACTDVGSRLDKDWLKNIIEPFRENPEAMAVSGFFLPEPKTYFEKVSATLMLDPNDQVDIATWLPSSRSIAYKKTAWAKAGGYPEHTNFNEDTPFDLALKREGYRFEDGLKAIVYWRPRPNLREFYRQYYFYAVGDGIDKIYFKHFVRLTVRYGLVLVVLIAAAVVNWLIFVLLLTLCLLQILKRVYRPWRKLRGVKTLALMGLLITAYDLSQIHGYWYGNLNRNRLNGSSKLVR
jgi:glycosyltransferase involved in cell wall biosynthesis